MSANISGSGYPIVKDPSNDEPESGACTASRNCNVTEPSAPIDALHISTLGGARPVRGSRNPPCT